MKKLLFILCAIVFVPAVASAQNAEVISEYRVFLDVRSDSTVGVTEYITYNFGQNQKHGIFRTIPYKYTSNAGSVSAPISDISVLQDGVSAPFTVNRSSGVVEIKIGDANREISGEHVYAIQYTVSRSVGYFDDHDEVYWDAIGTSWQVPVLKAAAEVVLPKSAAGGVTATCYTGAEGSTDQSCVASVSQNTITYSVSRELGIGEGLTIVAGFSKGIVQKPSETEALWQKFLDNWPIAIPVVVFGIMYLIWWKYGKDEKGRGTVIPQYEPPAGLTPLTIGSLVDATVDNRDIAAEIVFLATKGYLAITREVTKQLYFFTKEGFILRKVKASDASLTDHEKKLFDALFAGGDMLSISSLKTNKSFHKSVDEIHKSVFNGLTEKQYYKHNPTKLRTAFLVAAAVIVFVVLKFLDGFLTGITVASLILSGIIVGVFSFLMPARSKKGAEANESIKGLKLYLEVAEKDRLAFHNAPELNPQTFEKLLPYAIALGVEKKWAQKFSNLALTPAWYSDTSGAAFNAVYFGSSMHQFSSSVNAAMVSGSKSGGSGFGGGFSGGGGGGGGGGSW